MKTELRRPVSDTGEASAQCGRAMLGCQTPYVCDTDALLSATTREASSRRRKTLRKPRQAAKLNSSQPGAASAWGARGV